MIAENFASNALKTLPTQTPFWLAAAAQNGDKTLLNELADSLKDPDGNYPNFT